MKKFWVLIVVIAMALSACSMTVSFGTTSTPVPPTPVNTLVPTIVVPTVVAPTAVTFMTPTQIENVLNANGLNFWETSTDNSDTTYLVYKNTNGVVADVYPDGSFALGVAFSDPFDGTAQSKTTDAIIGQLYNADILGYVQNCGANMLTTPTCSNTFGNYDVATQLNTDNNGSQSWEIVIDRHTGS